MRLQLRLNCTKRFVLPGNSLFVLLLAVLLSLLSDLVQRRHNPFDITAIPPFFFFQKSQISFKIAQKEKEWSNSCKLTWRGRDRTRPRLGSACPIRRTRTRIFASWCFLLWTLTLWFYVKLRLWALNSEGFGDSDWFRNFGNVWWSGALWSLKRSVSETEWKCKGFARR